MRGAGASHSGDSDRVVHFGGAAAAGQSEPMSRTSMLWTVALVVTLVAAVYQRVTGPSYPVRGTVTLGGRTYDLRVERTHLTTSDQEIRLRIPDPLVEGEVRWRRFPSQEAHRLLPLHRDGDVLEAALPHQPPAGKLEFQILLRRGVEQQLFPPRPAVTRFKDPESLWVLIPHILAMFTAMLLSTRTGLAALTGGRLGLYAGMTLVFLVAGGFVLGPIVQHQAFGAYWTGVPFGFDLTDNKVLIALVAWGVAAWMVGQSGAAHAWPLSARRS